jgi:hypothetical protein
MKDELYILWTNADPVTAEKMVFMYARNALLKGWWKKVTVIIWGSTAKTAAESEAIKGQIELFRSVGGECHGMHIMRGSARCYRETEATGD